MCIWQINLINMSEFFMELNHVAKKISWKFWRSSYLFLDFKIGKLHRLLHNTMIYKISAQKYNY